MSKFETDNWSSTLYRKYNNLYAMGCVKKRPTNQIACTEAVFDVGQNQSFGIYRSLEDASRDLIMWLDHTSFPTTVLSVREFVSELKRRGYFTGDADSYAQGVQYYYDRLS